MASSKGYNGNPNLSRAGEEFEWTKEQALELKKCMKDPVYFAEKYFKIVSVDDGIIPLKMYDFQKQAIRKYAQKKRKLAVCCSRQIGKTTFATAIILHYALFNKDRRIALLANKGDTAREILSRVKLAFEYLPKWLQGGVREWNKGSVEFENGSTIIAASSSSSAIRGKSCVSGRTTITVRNKESGVVETITMSELEYRLFDSSINTNVQIRDIRDEEILHSLPDEESVEWDDICRISLN